MYKIETEQEIDGRWIAAVKEIPGVMCYGESQAEAMRKVQVLTLRVLADRIEHQEASPEIARLFSIN